MERRSRSQATGGAQVPPADQRASEHHQDDDPRATAAACPGGSRVQTGHPLIGTLPADQVEGFEQRAGEEAFAAAAGDEGQRVEVSWGDELFQPVRFNGMRVGPFTATTMVRRGETIAQATVRLHREIASAAQQVFEEKSRAYIRNLVELASAASKVEIPG